METQIRRTKGKIVAKQADSSIIEEDDENGGKREVQFVGRIDKGLYSCVSKDITTDEVIITDERAQHIRERHPNDYERFVDYMPSIIAQPDYILTANKANTAVLLKEIVDNGEKFKLILRLKVYSDPIEYKNSIISFWHIGETTWRKSLKNKKILYKSG